jgi:hypothetical protein
MDEIKAEFPYPVEARRDLPESSLSIVASIQNNDIVENAWVNDFEFEGEVEVPERNYPVSDTVLERAIENKRRIAIRPGRLKFLQYLEAKMPEMIKEAMEQYMKEKLNALHKKDKMDPTAVNARVKRYVDKNRDEINARRREKRKAMKLSILEAEDTKKEVPITNSEKAITVNF